MAAGAYSTSSVQEANGASSVGSWQPFETIVKSDALSPASPRLVIVRATSLFTISIIFERVAPIATIPKSIVASP